jgi:hypothetical protein
MKNTKTKSQAPKAPCTPAPRQPFEAPRRRPAPFRDMWTEDFEEMDGRAEDADALSALDDFERRYGSLDDLLSM